MTLKVFTRPDGAHIYRAAPPQSAFKSRLPAGVYTLSEESGFGEMEYWFCPLAADNDPPLDIRPEVREITEEIRNFLGPEMRQFFRRFGFAHKRGYLLYGQPGTGKSATIRLLEKRFIEQFDGVVLIWTNGMVSNFVEAIRSDEPERPIMVVVEDIEEQLVHFERAVLEFLDGQKALNNFVLVATTNHLDEIPERIKHRPSRIDRLLEIAPPDADARAAYLQRLGLTKAEIESILPHTDGLSMAHLKEMVISTMGFGRDPVETSERLKSLGPVPPAPVVSARVAIVKKLMNDATARYVGVENEEP